jgi:hypothetical protein
MREEFGTENELAGENNVFLKILIFNINLIRKYYEYK